MAVGGLAGALAYLTFPVADTIERIVVSAGIEPATAVVIGLTLFIVGGAEAGVLLGPAVSGWLRRRPPG